MKTSYLLAFKSLRQLMVDASSVHPGEIRGAFQAPLRRYDIKSLLARHPEVTCLGKCIKYVNPTSFSLHEAPRTNPAPLL